MIDYLIVGGGLSGSCLAYRLEKAGKSFLLFEDGSQKASKVAGGIINPVILKRFTLAKGADVQLAEALQFYAEIEEHLKMSFLDTFDLYRRFSSIEEQNNWFQAADKPSLAPFLDTTLVSSINESIPGKYSFGKVLHTYRMDIQKFLSAYSEHLRKNNLLKDEAFDHSQLLNGPSSINYKNISAKNVIFCEGFGMQLNPFFNYLPLKGNKGEYVVIKAPKLKLNAGVKSSVFIFPIGNDLYKVGATYNNKDQSQEPTTEARQELVKKLQELITADFEIVDQVAGIRPTTPDRNPLVGRHPEHKNLFICNGFGSRGILSAPMLSRKLLSFIEESVSLEPSIDISRFSKRYSEGN